jgi:signal transduction histidine kinase
MRRQTLAWQLTVRLLLVAAAVGFVEILYVSWSYFGGLDDVTFDDIWHEIAEHVAGPVLPLILVTGIASAMIARRAVAPLGRVAERAAEIGWHRGGERLPTEDLPAEAAELVVAVNTALDRLDGVLGNLREFTADVAHDLRTPLAAMTLDLAAVPPPARDRLAAQIEAMTARVEQLLALAQVEAQAVATDSRVDLAAVARETAIRLAPLAVDRGHTLALDIIDALPARGHAGAIGVVLQNLIDNALRHTPPGTAVTLRVGPGPSLTVRDTGPGIPAAIRARALDRYAGAGDSRGTGLGLAIVARTVAAMGGAIAIAEPEGGGTAVTVTLPPAGAGESG